MQNELYKIAVDFQRKLRTGVVNALTVTDTVRFVSTVDAETWVKDVSRFDKNGMFSDFKIRKLG
jgi:hypothetical protein